MSPRSQRCVAVACLQCFATYARAPHFGPCTMWVVANLVSLQVHCRQSLLMGQIDFICLFGTHLPATLLATLLMLMLAS